MSIITANNMRVLSGTITLVRTGPWHCDLDLDGNTPPAPGAAITIKDGPLEFKGTVIRAGTQAQHVHVRAIGGKGGLQKTIGARSYVSTALRLPLEDILTAAGETLDATSDATILGTRLDHYTRVEDGVGNTLKVLLELVGATWRVQPNGTVWVGVDSYPEQKLSGTVQAIEQDPLLGRFEIAPDLMDLRPGVTYKGQRISRVDHHIDGGKLRTTYFVEDGTGAAPYDRVVGPLKKLIRQEMARFRYHALFAAVVQGQDAAGLLELYPDDGSIRGSGTSKVPIKHGLPGVTVKVPVGTRVLLGFQNGDPRKPYAALFDPDSINEIVFDKGTKAIARIDDAVDAGTLSLNTPQGISGTYTPPGGTPVTIAPSVPFSLTGKIASGNPKWKA